MKLSLLFPNTSLTPFRPPLSLLWSRSNVVVDVIVSVWFLLNRVAVLTLAGVKGAVVDGDEPQTPVYLLTTVACARSSTPVFHGCVWESCSN